MLCGALQSGSVMDVLKGVYQDGLDTHIAVDNSWALIEARPSEVLDRAAAGVLQGSGHCKIPESRTCCSPVLVPTQEVSGGHKFLRLNRVCLLASKGLLKLGHVACNVLLSAAKRCRLPNLCGLLNGRANGFDIVTTLNKFSASSGLHK